MNLKIDLASATASFTKHCEPHNKFYSSDLSCPDCPSLVDQFKEINYDWKLEACKTITALLPPAEEIEKPSRYNKGSIEVWDFILDQGMGFLDGNVCKYLCRFKHKNGIEDLKKARVYLDKLIKEEESK